MLERINLVNAIGCFGLAATESGGAGIARHEGDTNGRKEVKNNTENQHITFFGAEREQQQQREINNRHHDENRRNNPEAMIEDIVGDQRNPPQS